MDRKTVLMIIAQVNFRDEELMIPQKVFKRKGANVYIAAPTKKTAKGMLGALVEPDYSIEEAVGLKFDILAIVGGSGAPDHLWNNSALLTMVRTHYATGRPLGAICLAPVVLARSGILRGKEATAFRTQSTIDEFENYGVTMKYRNVLVSGSVVTANGPSAARSFALSLGELF